MKPLRKIVIEEEKVDQKLNEPRSVEL